MKKKFAMYFTIKGRETAMRRNRNDNGKKERIIMLASSAFVLTALTMTGIYMQTKDEESRDDGYMLDFTTLEDNVESKYQEIAGNDIPESGAQDVAQLPDQGNTENSPAHFTEQGNLEDDLDFMPLEAGSGRIELPGLTDEALDRQKNEAAEDHEAVLPGTEEHVAEPSAEPVFEPEAVPAAEPSAEAIPEEAPSRELHFAESEGLRRPVDGEVLIPFSMDGSVYFSTLDQYKYNPALMLVAQEGTSVLACAEGQVVDIFENAEIGRAVTMDLGDGYRITYGQLKDITISQGSYVNSGEVIGVVAAPTKYYSIEGANLYLKLTANGTPVDPEALFQ